MLATSLGSAIFRQFALQLRVDVSDSRSLDYPVTEHGVLRGEGDLFDYGKMDRLKTRWEKCLPPIRSQAEGCKLIDYCR